MLGNGVHPVLKACGVLWCVPVQVRGGGVGQALIEAVYAAADQQGATKLYWQTHEMNYRARGLYDKMGRKSAFILYERS